MKTKAKNNLLKISEVAKASGVSVQTIHYYLREGLLTIPIKTARNMAYYDPVVVDEIRLIKELQEKRYLPITVIKKILHAKREGQSVDHVEEMRSLFEKVFYRQGTGNSEGYSAADLVVATGVDEAAIREMEEMGLLNSYNKEGKLFDELDERIARVIKRLLELGLTLKDLIVYSHYVEIIHSEMKMIYGSILPRVHDGSISLTELTDLLGNLKVDLAHKVYRQALMKHNPEKRNNEE